MRRSVVDPLPGHELGRIFARDHVVHIVLLPGRLAETLVMDAGRLAGLKHRSRDERGPIEATMNEEAGANG